MGFFRYSFYISHMPIIKSAIKKMKQDIKRTKRNNVFRNRLTTRMKELEQAVHDKKVDVLPKLLTETYSIIDTAQKKNLIKKNNAARKKSRMARLVNEVTGKGGAKTKAEEKAVEEVAA